MQTAVTPAILKNYLSLVLERKDLPFQTLSDCMERESKTLLSLSNHYCLKAAIALERGELILEKYKKLV